VVFELGGERVTPPAPGGADEEDADDDG